MAKNKTEIHVTTVFDGELGAALCVRIISGDVFTDGTGMVEASCKYKETVEWNREQNRVF